MSTTQQHLIISDIWGDIVFLKGGGGALVLEVGAVNFGLLSQREQAAIMAAFAQMLNSLSFSIQIVIISQQFNITSYLQILDEAKAKQTNPLLAEMMSLYRQFVQTTIKENEVLDKKFYIVIPLFSLELGLVPTRQALLQKVKTVLLPRRDQVTRGLNRIGLKNLQLTTDKLVELFFTLYNGSLAQTVLPPAVNLKAPVQPKVVQEAPKNQQPVKTDIAPAQSTAPSRPRNHPFVVEELGEENV